MCPGGGGGCVVGSSVSKGSSKSIRKGSSLLFPSGVSGGGDGGGGADFLAKTRLLSILWEEVFLVDRPEHGCGLTRRRAALLRSCSDQKMDYRLLQTKLKDSFPTRIPIAAAAVDGKTDLPGVLHS